MRSFIQNNRIRGDTVLSLCSFVRRRLIRPDAFASWRRPDVEIVVAEFGERPILPAEVRDAVDTYVFAFMPDDAPLDHCWWRNVAAWQAWSKHVLIVDCDIALSPAAYDTLLPLIAPRQYIRPNLVMSSKTGAFVPPLRSVGGYESVMLIELETLKAAGGWPETFVGHGFNGHSALRAFQKRLAAHATEHTLHDASLFCRVPHMTTGPENLYVQKPLFPGAPMYDDKAGGPWPVDGWKPGNPYLLDP